MLFTYPSDTLVNYAINELQSLINDLFGGGQNGLFGVFEPVVLGEQRLYKLSDFTDPVTADGDPVGGGQEVSGNDNHLTQPTSADRPTYNTDGTLHWLGFDNVSDFMDMSSVEAAVTTTVSVFMTHRRADTEQIILLAGSTSGDYTFIAEAGNTAGPVVSSQGGTPPGSVVRIDGVEKPTRDAIHLATNDLGWHVWEVEGLTLKQWGAFYMGNYGSNVDAWRINGDCAGIVAVEESSPIDRERVRSYMAELGGFTL